MSVGENAVRLVINTFTIIIIIWVAVISRYRTTFARFPSGLCAGLPFLLQPGICLSTGNPQHQYVPYGLWCDITSVSCPLANYLVTKPLPSHSIAPPPHHYNTTTPPFPPPSRCIVIAFWFYNSLPSPSSFLCRHKKERVGKRQYKGKEVLCSIPGIPPLWCLKTPPVTGVLAGPHLILPPVSTGPRQPARQLQGVSKCGHKERTFN